MLEKQEILNATLEASSYNGIILSYEYESVVDTNINNIVKLNEIYNELTKSDKKIAIVSKENWNKIKKEYNEEIIMSFHDYRALCQIEQSQG